jgi:hypothetical protein
VLKAIFRFTVLLALVLTGCSVTVRVPSTAFSLVGKADDQGLEIEHAFNTTVVHLPGLTWSIAGTYLSGSKPAAAITPRTTYVYRSPGAWSLTIRRSTECPSAEAGAQELSEALDRMFHAVGGMPSRGSVIFTLVPLGGSVKHYVVALRPGRRYALSFMAPCSRTTPNDDLLIAALIGIHESTHAALSLAGEQPVGANERERIAIGAGACLVWSLANGRAHFLKEHPLLVDELAGRFELATEHRSLNAWCDGWLSYMRAANAKAGRTTGRSAVTTRHVARGPT